MIYSAEDFEADPLLATDTLGALLRTGVLRLFLGAGVSIGFGLPGWRMLIARTLKREGDAAFLASLQTMGAKEQASLIDELDDESVDYLLMIKDALYRDVSDDLVERLQRSPLLLAVAALITGGLSRGRVESVVSYNYDDLLEQYLEMLGYGVCVRTRPDDVSTRAEVEIDHPHGWIPQGWDGVRQLEQPLLSERSYRARRAEIDAGWSALVEHGLMSKIGLFLGMSGDDSTVLDILARAKKHMRRSSDYYMGYWLLTPDAFTRNSRAIRDVGHCPVRVEKDRIPAFLLRTCQVAAGKVS
jgi:hypothetical protein